MWISMCKNSVFNVYRDVLIHIKFIIDKIKIIKNVVIHSFLHIYNHLYTIVILIVFSFIRSLIVSYRQFPQELLLLLLLIKFYIINKNLNFGIFLKRSFC